MSHSPLDKLDKQIAKVVARVRKLETDNEKLRQKAAKLEQSLESAPRGGTSKEWEQERAAVRSRVEKLTEHLETVLGE
ncbi:MAG: cell division protein ZapB [Deltaproteobacteria bacterium]|nr:cell division protein ZapB [Deltaproteobacteria bacterium]